MNNGNTKIIYIMRVYKDVGLVEQLGSGMSRILKAYDKSIFDISENFLIVTFKFEKVAINNGGNEPADKSKVIIDFLKKNQYASSVELSNLISLSVRRTREILKYMIDEGLIITEDANKNRVYKLNKKD